MEYVQLYKDEFDRLWDLLVPEDGDAKSIQGKLVRAIGRLHHEWSNNGNCNWPESKFYPDFVDTLAIYLVPGYWSESEVSREVLEDFEFDYPFDSPTRKQIMQDIGFIQLAGLSQDMYLEKTQAENIIRAALPDNDPNAPFHRIKDRIVEFCRANPDLQYHYGEEQSENEIKSVSDIFSDRS